MPKPGVEAAFDPSTDRIKDKNIIKKARDFTSRALYKLNLFFNQVMNKLIEQIVGIIGPGTRLGMVLN